MDIPKYISMLVVTLALIFAILISVSIFAEACDVYDNWTCGISDDGYRDGVFNWRHGVFPW